MSVTLDPAKKILPITHPTISTLCDSKPKTITRDVYLPRYKGEDNVRALLYEAGLIDQTGKIDRHLVHLTEIPLNPEEQSRVKNCLAKIIHVVDGNFNLHINAHNLLSDFFTPNETNEILPLIFTHLEIVGSAVNQCLGLSFFKRFTEHLFKSAFAGKDDAFVQDLLNKLFTPEFEHHLNQRLNRKLADLDLRISTLESHPYLPALKCLQNAFDKFMWTLIGKLPLLEGEKEKNRRIELLQLVKSRIAILNWDWLNIDDPQFYYHVFKNLAFNKLMLITKEGEQFGILNIGNSKDFLVDFVFVLQLPRFEMFPSVRIPCKSLLTPTTAENPLYPTGENWVQALLDTLMGCVRPDISKATEDDFKMLQCRKTKGEINAVPGSEAALLQIVREESVNSKNKTVKRILKNHSELYQKPEKNFPYFLAQMIKDAVETHFDKDPLAAIAMTINTCESMQDDVTAEEREIFISEMANYWEKQYFDVHPLYVIARLFTEKHVLDDHNAHIRKLSLIKICAFLHCQTSARSATDAAIMVYPRINESKPCWEVIVKSTARNYSLLLDGASPRSLLMDTLKYLQITKSLETLKSIESVIEHFLLQITFGGARSSPMLDDLRFFDHDLDFFEKTATSSLILQQPLLGMFVLFATQAQLREEIPLQSIMINFPLIITRILRHQAFVFDHVVNLIQDPVLIQALKKLRNYIAGTKSPNDEPVIEKWITLLGQEKSLLPLAKQCFIETLHQLPSVSFENRKNVLIKLYQQSKRIEPSFAVKILQFIQEKSYAPVKEQIEYLKDLLGMELHDPQDLVRLEKIAELIFQTLKKGHFKNETRAFQSILPMLAARSPKVQFLIQRLQTPIYVQHEETAPLGAERITQHVLTIQSLAEGEYEKAAESLYDLGGFIFSIPQGAILAIMEKIVARALQENNLALVQVLLRHDFLHEYFLVEPEAFFTLIITSLNRIEQTNLRGKEDAIAAILEKVLKSYTNNQAPRLSLDTVHRLTELCVSVFNDRYYLLKPLPENYLRTFTQAFNTLFFSLNVKNAHLDCIRLYYTIYTYDRANPNIAKSASFARESLQHLLAGPSFTDEMENIANSIIVPIINHSCDASRLMTVKVLFELLEKTRTVSRKFAYLEHLANLGSLDNVEILPYLFPLFESLITTNQYRDALRVIQFFKGSVSSESFPDSRRYHQFIGKLIRDDERKLACQALALNPFIWTVPSFQSKMNEYANTLLEKMKSEETLSLSELKWIFTVIEKHAIRNLDVVSHFYEKCESVMDSSLASKLKAIYIAHLMKASSQSKHHVEKPLFIVLKALRFLSNTESEHFLSNSHFLEYCSKNTPEVRFEIYRLLWKTLLSLIKNSRSADQKKLIKQIDTYVDMWLNGLKIINGLHIQQARVDLIEYYLSTNDPELLTDIIDHLAICGRMIDQTPTLKDAYKRLLRLIHQRMHKHEFLDDTIRLTMVLDELSKSDIPPLELTSCLDLCYDAHSLEIGMRIINNCLNLKTFTREEIPKLKSYKFSNYLMYVIKHANLSERAICENILSKPRLCLFVSQEDLWAMESLMSERYFADAVVDGNEVPTLTQKAMEYVCAKFYGIAEMDYKGIFKKTARIFFVSYFTHQDDTYVSLLINTLKQTPRASESILMLAIDIRKKIYNLFWDNYEESRLVQFFHAINALLIDDLPKKRTLSTDILNNLKMWVALQSSSKHPALANLTREFVAKLDIILRQYPRDLFEIRMIQAIQLREPLSPYMLEPPEDVSDIFKSIATHLNGLKDKNTKGSLYEDYKHFCYLAKAIPFSCEENKIDRLSYLIETTFTLIAILPEEKQDATLDELIPFWIEFVGDNSLLLIGSLTVYIADQHEFYIRCLRKKLTTLLNLALLKKLPISSTDLLINVISSLRILVNRIADRLGDDIIGLKKIDNEQLLLFFKEIFDQYIQFYNELSVIGLSDQDKMEACEKYVHILHLVINKFPAQLAIKDPQFIIEILTNAELMLRDVPRSNKSIKTTCNTLQKRVLPTLKQRFQQRCTFYKKN